MHLEFHCNGNTEATTDQTINSTREIEVGLSGGWPAPHKKAVIRNVHVISIASQSSKLSLLQQCIENFIAMAIPRQLLTRRSIQHDPIEVGLSGGWPVPHKKAVIRNIHVISIASQSSKLSLLQQCIENFIAMAIPRQLLTRRSIQHEQLRLD